MNGVGIPKILHQTVKDKKHIPEKWLKCQKTWMNLHRSPEWQHYLYSDDDNDSFMRKEYPMYYQLYLDLPVPIERVDLVRYLYLHKYGGWYADMDTEVLKPIDELCHLQGKSVVLGQRQFLFSSMVECAFMGSLPNDPFWLIVVHAIHQSFYSPPLSKQIFSIIKSVGVLMTTGPLLLDSVVQSLPVQMKDRIQIFPQSYFFANPDMPKEQIPRNSFLIHHSDTSWVDGPEYVLSKMHRDQVGKTGIICLIIVTIVALFFTLFLIITLVAKTTQALHHVAKKAIWSFVY